MAFIAGLPGSPFGVDITGSGGGGGEGGRCSGGTRAFSKLLLAGTGGGGGRSESFLPKLGDELFDVKW